jgi:Family of unknown function (DUF5906)
VRPVHGDPGPWLEFMEQLVPNEEDRHNTLKWCATLMAKPEVRMQIALLMISEKQGVGKTTLGGEILASIIGKENTSFPGSNEMTSQFNSWVAHKRLAVVNEIYHGASWKVYNDLKSVISDKEIMVNTKFVKAYTIENWCHVFACSNSMKALKMTREDRRWLIPQLTDVIWPREKFIAFYEWLDNGGRNVILHWAKTWGDYFTAADRAPRSETKTEMAEHTRSEALLLASEIGDAVADSPAPKAISARMLGMVVRARCTERVYETDMEMLGEITECRPDDMFRIKKYVKIGSIKHYVVVNAALKRLIEQNPDQEGALVRQHMMKPEEVSQGAAI